jgi:protein-S-isoprenylcysteine O-methyltransferase Ste14
VTNSAVLVLCLGVLATIGSLPRIFFRPGRLNLDWWLTAAPFFVTAAVIGAGLVGFASPFAAASPGRDAAAVVLGGASLLLLGYTLGTHTRPLGLWHQKQDVPEHLVTEGAYAWVRHPFYAAFLLALGACTIAFPHPATVGALAYATVRLNRTAAAEEERFLRSAFAASYAAYVVRTGRFWPRAGRSRPLLRASPSPSDASAERHGPG